MTQFKLMSKSSAHIRTCSATKCMELEKLILFQSLKFSLVLCNLTFHYRVHICFTLVPIRSQINPVHALPFHYLDTLFNIILPLRLVLSMFCFFQVPHKNPTTFLSCPVWPHVLAISFSVNLMFVWLCILSMKWRVRPTRCNKLWFINNPLAQHVSGIIMPIFRSARPYVTAYGFQPI